jgi:diguanylate cyclase
MKNYSFKNLSDDAKAKISSLEVVPPSLYATIFTNLAKAHNIPLSDEERHANEMLDTKLNKIDALEEVATKKVDQLDKSTQKAMTAMTDNDENLLNEAIGETQALRLEIETLKKSLYKDALTKVYNRKWLNSEILDDEEAFINAGSLFLIDMNYFKHINDTYGHIAGDKVLIYVAKHIQKLEADIVRYGGDEFIAIFKNKTTSEVAQAMHLNRELLIKKQLKFADKKFSTSYSYGGVNIEVGGSFSMAIEEADGYMYEDKEKVKQRVNPN